MDIGGRGAWIRCWDNEKGYVENDTGQVNLARLRVVGQNWGAKEWSKDPYGRVLCDVPPAKNGDYAWIQHMIASMKEDTGRVGVVMPHGVLFRGGKEGAIRQCLLEKDLLLLLGLVLRRERLGCVLSTVARYRLMSNWLRVLGIQL